MPDCGIGLTLTQSRCTRRAQQAAADGAAPRRARWLLRATARQLHACARVWAAAGVHGGAAAHVQRLAARSCWGPAANAAADERSAAHRPPCSGPSDSSSSSRLSRSCSSGAGSRARRSTPSSTGSVLRRLWVVIGLLLAYSFTPLTRQATCLQCDQVDERMLSLGKGCRLGHLPEHTNHAVKDYSTKFVKQIDPNLMPGAHQRYICLTQHSAQRTDQTHSHAHFRVQSSCACLHRFRPS